MYYNLKYHIDDMKRKITSYREALNRIKPDLLLEKTGPLETATIYFKVVEFNYYIKGLIKIRNEYKSLNLFTTPFEEKIYMPLNTLWVMAEDIDAKKDNFASLIDLKFLKSKDRTMRLWNYDISEMVIIYERMLDELETYIDNAPDTWYNMYKHLEGPKFFLDKDTMSMHKMINDTEDKDFSSFEFYTLEYNEDMKPSHTKNSFRPESELPKFIEDKLNHYYPEYLL